MEELRWLWGDCSTPAFVRVQAQHKHLQVCALMVHAPYLDLLVAALCQKYPFIVLAHYGEMRINRNCVPRGV